jgi:hypothetical protein
MRIGERDDGGGEGWPGSTLVDQEGAEVRMWESLSFRGRTWSYCCVRLRHPTGASLVDLRPDPNHRSPWAQVWERELAQLARVATPTAEGDLP